MEKAVAKGKEDLAGLAKGKRHIRTAKLTKAAKDGPASGKIDPNLDVTLKKARGKALESARDAAKAVAPVVASTPGKIPVKTDPGR